MLQTDEYLNTIRSSHGGHTYFKSPRQRAKTNYSISDPVNMSSKLPLRPILGSYDPPILGTLIDRLNYFWFQGPEKFFTTKSQENKSTVFRTNMPPGPPGFCNNTRVVMLLDAKSFAMLFDNETVKNKNVLTGTFAPSLHFTGGYRVLPYLDPSKSQHTKLKASVCILQRMFQSCCTESKQREITCRIDIDNNVSLTLDL